jgi:RNA polymerase sigma-70 factor (ECF subfamily)
MTTPLLVLVPCTEPSDEALVDACAAGDAAALGKLFDRHHETVYRFLTRLAGTDAASREDLVQNTFLEARCAAPRFAGRSSVKAWLLGIAANLVRHDVRGEIRRKRLMLTYAEVPRPPGTSPHEAAERRELVERLSVALRELPHDLRVAFVLCDLEEVRGTEAARALGVREGTLGRRLHDARRALRLALEGRSR